MKYCHAHKMMFIKDTIIISISRELINIQCNAENGMWTDNIEI